MPFNKPNLQSFAPFVTPLGDFQSDANAATNGCDSAVIVAPAVGGFKQTDSYCSYIILSKVLAIVL